MKIIDNKNSIDNIDNTDNTNNIIKNNVKYGCYLCGIDEDQIKSNKISDRTFASYQIPIRIPPICKPVLQSSTKRPSSSSI